MGWCWTMILLCIISYYWQSDVDHSLTMGNIPPAVDSQPVDLSGEEVDALRGKYIRRLTAVLTHHIPAFWKVALSVFSGKFAKVFRILTSLDFTCIHGLYFLWWILLKINEKWNIQLLWHLFHADTYILPSTLLTSLSFVYFFWYHYHEESI